MPFSRRTLAIAAVLAAAALPIVLSLGSSEMRTIEITTESAPETVVREWADTLRSGDAEAAAELFAVPAIVQNGTPPLELRSRSAVVEFNESLPCGARVIESEQRGRFVVATFELTERPGPGNCGSGAGGKATTAFLVEGGLIVQWRRVPTPEGGAPPGQIA